MNSQPLVIYPKRGPRRLAASGEILLLDYLEQMNYMYYVRP